MEWNGMVCKIRKLNGFEQYGMEWDGWDGFPKHSVNSLKMIWKIVQKIV